jgi:hypothetical protein
MTTAVGGKFGIIYLSATLQSWIISCLGFKLIFLHNLTLEGHCPQILAPHLHEQLLLSALWQ